MLASRSFAVGEQQVLAAVCGQRDRQHRQRGRRRRQRGRQRRQRGRVGRRHRPHGRVDPTHGRVRGGVTRNYYYEPCHSGNYDVTVLARRGDDPSGCCRRTRYCRGLTPTHTFINQSDVRLTPSTHGVATVNPRQRTMHPRSHPSRTDPTAPTEYPPNGAGQ